MKEILLLNIGDKVFLKATSRYVSSGSSSDALNSNPTNMLGEIIEKCSTEYRVKWSNGKTNCNYNDFDLKLSKDFKKIGIKPFKKVEEVKIERKVIKTKIILGAC